MKVLNLAKDDIVWIYNITSDSYAELQVVQHNLDGTTRFRCTGTELENVPEDGELITNVNMMVTTLSDGSIQRYVVETSALSKKLRQLKSFIKTLLAVDFGG